MTGAGVQAPSGDWGLVGTMLKSLAGGPISAFFNTLFYSGGMSATEGIKSEPFNDIPRPGDQELDDLAGAGGALDPADKSGNLTLSGRALDKHGGRNFPTPTGSPSNKNAMGQNVLNTIVMMRIRCGRRISLAQPKLGIRS